MKRARDKIAIAGFGVEGQATFAHLRARGVEIHHIFDDRDIVPPELGVSVHQGLTIPADFDVVYKTPGIPTHKLQLVSERTRITNLTNLFLSEVQGTVVGITGTKGKSTIASLIHHSAKAFGKDAYLVGNIGATPLSLLENDGPDRLYVYEMSSFQCEHITKSPHVAVLTKVFPEHLNHHQTYEKYLEAKLNIARFQSKNDIFLNASGIDVFFAGVVVVPTLSKPFTTKLLGAHNQRNCAIAATTAKIVGIPESESRKAFETFAPLSCRLERVGEYRGVMFYDDSLATIPQATLVAIESLGNVNTIILGGEDRGIDFEDFAKTLSETKVEHFVVFPDTGERMVKYISEHKVFRANSMEEAVSLAYAKTEGVCLLSTASPSFNMFKDYKDKSEQYRHYIKLLGKT